jgi:tetratricopeptide (TPR) repeat protein
MFNVQELEKKWLRYKIKSYIPHATISIITILILILFLSYNINNIKKTAILNNKIKATKVIKVKDIKTIKKEINNHIKNPAKITLTPSLNFINSVKIKESIKNKNIPKPITKKRTIIKEEIPKINITRTNSSDNINEIIKRFKKSNSPALSLFLAKKYYALGNYNEAYNYALTTNKLKNNIEASWILFSKSLIKLNQKDKAIKVLKQYINYSGSNKAKVLLNNILAGKFK